MMLIRSISGLSINSDRIYQYSKILTQTTAGLLPAVDIDYFVYDAKGILKSNRKSNFYVVV
jgi:hypothetical protein